MYGKKVLLILMTLPHLNVLYESAEIMEVKEIFHA